MTVKMLLNAAELPIIRVSETEHGVAGEEKRSGCIEVIEETDAHEPSFFKELGWVDTQTNPSFHYQGFGGQFAV